MQNHVRVYFEYWGFVHQGEVMCEVCETPAQDIHHITPRIKFGKNRKHEQDRKENLIALCRDCHEKAHAKALTEEMLLTRMKK